MIADLLRKARTADDDVEASPAPTIPDHLLERPTAGFLNEDQLAERLGCSVSTLRGKRRDGKGPRFMRHGKTPKYRTVDVIAWEADQVRNSTSEEEA